MCWPGVVSSVWIRYTLVLYECGLCVETSCETGSELNAIVSTPSSHGDNAMLECPSLPPCRLLDFSLLRMREILRGSRRTEQRILIVAMKPPRDLVKVLLERRGWGGFQWGGGEEFDNVDLLISKSFSDVVDGAGPGVREQQEGALDVDEAMRELHRVFVVQVRTCARGLPMTLVCVGWHGNIHYSCCSVTVVQLSTAYPEGCWVLAPYSLRMHFSAAPLR